MIYILTKYYILYYKYIYLNYNLKFNIKLNFVISLAKLVKRLPSKQLIIGSNPIRCNKINFIKFNKY